MVALAFFQACQNFSQLIRAGFAPPGYEKELQAKRDFEVSRQRALIKYLEFLRLDKANLEQEIAQYEQFKSRNDAGLLELQEEFSARCEK